MLKIYDLRINSYRPPLYRGILVWVKILLLKSMIYELVIHKFQNIFAGV